MANKNGRRDLEKERFWRQTIERQQSSGMSIREFCESEGLKDWSFSWWRRELRRRDGKKPSSKRKSTKQVLKAKDAPPFVPVQVVPRSPASQSATAIEIVLPAGQTVRVPAGFDLDALAGVLGVLERQPC